jgi:hypothetical protein
MYFECLQLRLIAHVQNRVQRGELTERGLARRTGISQPHLHNVLKGVRGLSPEIGDVLLRHLHITLLDLLKEEERNGFPPQDSPHFPPGLAFRPKTAYPREAPPLRARPASRERCGFAEGPTEEAGGGHRRAGGER